MQLIAEAYDLHPPRHRQEPGRDRRDLPRAGTTGELESFLIEITAEVLAQVDAATGKAFVDVDPRPGRAEGHRPLDGADRARPRRPDHRHRRGDLRPGAVRRRAAARGRPRRCCRPARSSGGSTTPTPSSRTSAGALRVQGRRLLAGLRPDRRGQQRVRLGHRPRRDGADLARRLHHPGPLPEPHHRGLRARPSSCRCCWPTTSSSTSSTDCLEAWRRVVAGAAQNGIPTPAFSSSLAYYDGVRADRLPAALIQGLRDFFGAHTYRRIDDDGHLPHRVGRRPVRDRGRRRLHRGQERAHRREEGRPADLVRSPRRPAGAARRPSRRPGPAASAPRRCGGPATPPAAGASPSGPTATGPCPTAGSRSSSARARRTCSSSSSGACRWSTWPGRAGVFVVVDRPDTGAALLARSTLPVAFAPGSGALERLVEERDVRVALYVNQVERNFRMLRFAGPVHVQLGHGESDKAYSVSNQHKAYDLTFVGGRCGPRPARGGAARLRRRRRGRCGVGRPQLDHAYPGAPAWSRGAVGASGTPRPGRATGRASRTGRWSATASAVVESLVADPDVRVIYRPHPRTGLSSPAARRRRPGRPRGAGPRRRPVTWSTPARTAGSGPSPTPASPTCPRSPTTGWPRASRSSSPSRPSAAAYRPASRLLDELPLLPAADAGSALDVLRARGLGGAARGGGRPRCCATWPRTTSATRPTGRARAASRPPWPTRWALAST